ncbi:MAG: PepSY domain-containing protein [Proteobacteria bacterium]|nr:MAG: PepSY domain-containing protein [Pseudomonadota bacterium]
MKTRLFINKLHFYLALIAALPIAVLCITGSILVYKEAIDGYFTRPYMEVEVQDRKMSIADMRVRLQEELPGKEFLGVVLPEREGLSYFFWMKDAPFWTVAYINPYTGEFKGVRAWEDWTMANIIWWATDLHYSFKWGRVGSYIVAASSLTLFFSVITGLVLWWPRKSRFYSGKFTLRFHKRWKQTAFNLHGVLGLYTSLILAVVTLTGITITFFEPFGQLIHAITREEAPKHPDAMKPDPAEEFLPAEILLDTARTQLKERYGIEPKPQSITFPTAENAVTEIGWQGRSEMVGLEHSHVFLNAQTGEIIKVEAAGVTTSAETFVHWMSPIHYGTWGEAVFKNGDLVTRFIWLVAALVPIFLMISGFSIVKKSRWKNVIKRSL